MMVGRVLDLGKGPGSFSRGVFETSGMCDFDNIYVILIWSMMKQHQPML